MLDPAVYQPAFDTCFAGQVIIFFSFIILIKYSILLSIDWKLIN